MTDKPNEPMPDEVWIEDEVMYYAPRLYSPHKRAKYIRADKYDKLREALEEAVRLANDESMDLRQRESDLIAWKRQATEALKGNE